MTSCVKLAVPNSIVFLYDQRCADVAIPGYDPNQLTAATNTCVSVATLPEMDGETTISLIESESDATFPLVFDGELNTPKGSLSVNTSAADGLLSTQLGKQRFA